MPQETEATRWRSGSVVIRPRLRRWAMASTSATQPPVMEAVRVPPSAWITSQSMVKVRSPSCFMFSAERSARPMRRWISMVRPPCLPAVASRFMRLPVERGSMPYSAVTQPWPLPLRKFGTFSSTLTLHTTRVSPNSISTEPSACFV